METDFLIDQINSDVPPDGELPGPGPDPTGWWEIIGGTWRWITDPTPT